MFGQTEFFPSPEHFKNFETQPLSYNYKVSKHLVNFVESFLSLTTTLIIFLPKLKFTSPKHLEKFILHKIICLPKLKFTTAKF